LIFIFFLLLLFIAFLLFIYSFSTFITIWTVTKVHKFTQQQLYWGTHWWCYATRAVTKAYKFTRCSAPGHNRPIEPRSVNYKMESQGHYMETFSCLLVFHLSIDLFNCLLLIHIYVYSLFYPISIFTIIILAYFIVAFFINIDTYTKCKVILVK